MVFGYGFLVAVILVMLVYYNKKKENLEDKIARIKGEHFEYRKMIKQFMEEIMYLDKYIDEKYPDINNDNDDEDDDGCKEFWAKYRKERKAIAFLTNYNREYLIENIKYYKKPTREIIKKYLRKKTENNS